MTERLGQYFTLDEFTRSATAARIAPEPATRRGSGEHAQAGQRSARPTARGGRPHQDHLRLPGTRCEPGTRWQHPLAALHG